MSGNSTDDTTRVRVETPDATFDGSVDNPAEWEALVAFLEHKVLDPMETERVQERSQDTER
jgi:hypothetical protein